LLIRRSGFWILLLCCLAVAACGYRFTGGGDLPAGIGSVSISVLENRTTETGLENLITNDLIYQFTRSGKATVTDKDKSDAQLTGVIKSTRENTVSRSGTLTAVERRVTVTVDLKLTDREGRVIWATKDFSANEIYEVEVINVLTEENKKEALIKLSERLAENVYNRMTEDF